MKKISSKYKKYIRLAIGLLVLCLGAIFMLFPFIPLGYAFVVAGLFLLAFEIPPLRKLVNRLKKKDKKGRVDKVEKKIAEGDEIITKKFVADENDDSDRNKTN